MTEEMHKEEVQENQREFSFRKGYVHGVLSAVDLLRGGSDWRHLQWWCDEVLFPWMYGDCDSIIEPPEPASWRETRKRILERDKHTCHYCGRAATHVDHVVPASRGGSFLDDNLVAACRECNLSKRAQLPEEWKGPRLPQEGAQP